MAFAPVKSKLDTTCGKSVSSTWHPDRRKPVGRRLPATTRGSGMSHIRLPSKLPTLCVALNSSSPHVDEPQGTLEFNGTKFLRELVALVSRSGRIDEFRPPKFIKQSFSEYFM